MIFQTNERFFFFSSLFSLLFSDAYVYTVSAPFVAGPDANASRQRHAPLYGRLVAEEHLPAAHRDAVHQVSFANNNNSNEHRFLMFVVCCCPFFIISLDPFILKQNRHEVKINTNNVVCILYMSLLVITIKNNLFHFHFYTFFSFCSERIVQRHRQIFVRCRHVFPHISVIHR